MRWRAVLAVTGTFCLSACSSLWGFDDLAVGDAGGVDASTDDSSGSGSGGSSGSGSGGASDAAPDAAETGETCVTDLSNVGTGDFSIGFTITTTTTFPMVILAQRPSCMGGYPVFWDVGLNADGTLLVETCDGTMAGYGGLAATTAKVNDGASQKIVVARTAGILTVFIDGTPRGTNTDTTAIGTLPPLTIGTDVCVDAGESSLVGSLTDVCITRPSPILDAGACDGSGLVTHSTGVGQTWTDCVPLGTYTQAEAEAACRANGGTSCVVNTCSGAGQAICDRDPGVGAGYCTCWGFSGVAIVGRVVDTGSCTDPSLAGCSGLDPWN